MSPNPIRIVVLLVGIARWQTTAGITQLFAPCEFALDLRIDVIGVFAETPAKDYSDYCTHGPRRVAKLADRYESFQNHVGSEFDSNRNTHFAMGATYCDSYMPLNSNDSGFNDSHNDSPLMHHGWPYGCNTWMHQTCYFNDGHNNANVRNTDLTTAASV
jgi:hypothetical protein